MTRRERLLEMLKRNPEDPFLHYGLAMELVKEGNHDEALTTFDRVLAMDPCYLAAYYQKASALAAMGRVNDARQALTDGVNAARTAGDRHAESEMQAILDSLG